MTYSTPRNRGNRRKFINQRRKEVHSIFFGGRGRPIERNSGSNWEKKESLKGEKKENYLAVDRRNRRSIAGGEGNPVTGCARESAIGSEGQNLLSRIGRSLVLGQEKKIRSEQTRKKNSETHFPAGGGGRKGEKHLCRFRR